MVVYPHLFSSDFIPPAKRNFKEEVGGAGIPFSASPSFRPFVNIWAFCNITLIAFVIS